jgi:hypothetical protein
MKSEDPTSEMDFGFGLFGIESQQDEVKSPKKRPQAVQFRQWREPEIDTRPAYIHIGTAVSSRDTAPIISQSHTEFINQPNFQIQPGNFATHANLSYEFWFDAPEYHVGRSSLSTPNTSRSSSPELINRPEAGETPEQSTFARVRDPYSARALDHWEENVVELTGRRSVESDGDGGSEDSTSMRSLLSASRFPRSNVQRKRTEGITLSSQISKGESFLRECNQILDDLERVIDRFESASTDTKASKAGTRPPPLRIDTNVGKPSDQVIDSSSCLSSWDPRNPADFPNLFRKDKTLHLPSTLSSGYRESSPSSWTWNPKRQESKIQSSIPSYHEDLKKTSPPERHSVLSLPWVSRHVSGSSDIDIRSPSSPTSTPSTQNSNKYFPCSSSTCSSPRCHIIKCASSKARVPRCSLAHHDNGCKGLNLGLPGSKSPSPVGVEEWDAVPEEVIGRKNGNF